MARGVGELGLGAGAETIAGEERNLGLGWCWD